MKFLYSVSEPNPEDLKIKDGTKFGNIALDQTFFPRIVDEILGPQEHIFLHYQKIVKYLDEVIPNEPEELFDSVKYKSGVSGLIIPIQHGDMNEFCHIVTQLKKPYQDRLDPDVEKAWDLVHSFQQSHDFDYEHNQRYREALKTWVGGIERLFTNSFNIPVFEAYHHFPGHREAPIPIGMEKYARGDSEELHKRLKYVEGAFRVWIDINFKGKK